MLIQTQLMACIFQTSTLSCDHIFHCFHLFSSCVHSPSSSLECIKRKVFPNILPQQGSRKFQIFQGNCVWQWECIWKIFEETLFLSRQDETLHLMVMVMFGILWCLLGFYGAPSCLWPLLFQGGLISRFLFIFDRSDEKLKLWWNSSMLIMKHFDLMKWPRN